ncbi:MAG: ornithine carbamoyltransferase, partial [Halomonas sp.]
DFAGFQVTEAMLDQAAGDVIFLHCLPAHRGEEISTTLLDDPRAAVWQEAGNRLHAQKALIEFLLLGKVA